MNGAFHAVQVTDNVYWVGAIDWAVRDFHGYSTHRGTTYNAYLVLADKVTLIDTVKAGFFDEMFARISSVIDPSKIEVLVSNHAEPDHSGELAEALRVIEPEVVYASKNGQKALDAHYGLGEKITPVEDGQSVDLGSESIVFAETRMCHWPDSMVSYLPAQKLLFSQDAFGMHLACYERFAEQVDPGVLHFEAEKYYANILMPLSGFVAKALEKLTEAGWEMSILCPDHGPIWRAEPGKIIGWYAGWAAGTRTDKAIVLYDTMWKSTEKMARAVGEGLGAGGARPTLMPLSGTHRSDVATRLLTAGALLVGAPTLNNEIFPRIADVLTYIKGLRPEGLIGAAFGSFGWSGESVKKLQAFLEEMNVEIVHDSLKSKFVPGEDVYAACYELGKSVAGELNSRVG